jgi:uncharacterized damage-inducible protein DinB
LIRIIDGASMIETALFLAERLKVEGEKTTAFFASLTPEQWQAIVYTEGGEWTVRSVLAHYVAAEREFLNLFSDIQHGGKGVNVDFSVDDYNALQYEKMKNVSSSDLLGWFKSVREKMIDFVESLSETDLQKQGRHPALGITPLTEMIKLVYRHNQIHYRDIRKVVEKL